MVESIEVPTLCLKEVIAITRRNSSVKFHMKIHPRVLLNQKGRQEKMLDFMEKYEAEVHTGNSN